jgi:hypothetical protein
MSRRPLLGSLCNTVCVLQAASWKGWMRGVGFRLVRDEKQKEKVMDV